jgi:hypothetical protein
VVIKQKLQVFFLIAALVVLFIAAPGCDSDGAGQKEFNCYKVGDTCIYARTAGPYFEVFSGDDWSQLTVKGVNIGTSLPGRWYTEFPADRDLYHQWFKEITAMNANTIRLYTLLDPAFYSALAEYNSNSENAQLWLIQEIWPDDEVPDLNFFESDYKASYLKEIELTIDALHGSADIPARSYRAYGNYSADVSPWLLGLLVGRELEPEEVTATNEANLQVNIYEGSYVKAAAGASPTEVWLAEMSDYVTYYCQENYGRQHPVGFVSWPTLDPLTHLTEWEADGRPGYNDREVVDPNNFSAGPENKAGFFGAYHIYPNYPDFINNEPVFAEYSDNKGVFRYGGYLEQFMAIHPPYPALVAEFGISTSLNTSHISPDGLNHGGLSETDQGEMVVRMMKAIIEEGYAGGVVFEWSDEWAKKTWNTEPFMVPWERQVLWQNAMCPEQNYGVLAVEPRGFSPGAEVFSYYNSNADTSYQPTPGMESSFGRIAGIGSGVDEAYLYLTIKLDQATFNAASELPWADMGLLISIDVGINNDGSTSIPVGGLPQLPGGAQFVVVISSPEDAEILATPSYNRGLLNFEPEEAEEVSFSRIITLVNRERITPDGKVFPALYSDESVLNQGNFWPESDSYNSLAHWYTDAANEKILLRLPWMLLNVADPSSGLLLNDGGTFTDLPARDELSVSKTEGFRFYAATFSKETGAAGGTSLGEVIDFAPRDGSEFKDLADPYLWEGWEEPQYRFRLKDSYKTIAGYFGTLE